MPCSVWADVRGARYRPPPLLYLNASPQPPGAAGRRRRALARQTQPLQGTGAVALQRGLRSHSRGNRREPSPVGLGANQTENPAPNETRPHSQTNGARGRRRASWREAGILRLDAMPFPRSVPRPGPGCAEVVGDAGSSSLRSPDPGARLPGAESECVGLRPGFEFAFQSPPFLQTLAGSRVCPPQCPARLGLDQTALLGLK